MLPLGAMQDSVTSRGARLWTVGGVEWQLEGDSGDIETTSFYFSNGETEA